jgi:hypothetical protein
MKPQSLRKMCFSQNRQLYTTFTLQIRPEILSKIFKNMKKQERNGVFKEYFILSVGRFIAKI